MGSNRRFILNAVLLSAVAVAVRAVSVSFNAYVALKVGAECMGLFTLVTSVYSFCVIIACAGVNLAVTRRCAEAASRAERDGVSARGELVTVVRAALLYSAFFGILAGAAVFLLSDIIGRELLGDARCVPSLRAFALSLPAISCASALNGYFTGVGKVCKNAVCTVLEESVKILFISAGLVLIAPRGIEYACLAIVGGGAAAQGVSLLNAAVLYLFDKKGKRHGGEPGRTKLFREIKATASCALPVAAGSAARFGLITAEHVAIPPALVKYGLSRSAALSVYGVMNGMVMPVVTFPSAVLYSFASLLIPEIAGCRASGNRRRIARIEKAVFRSSLLFSVCASGIFIAFADEIGEALYREPEASRQLRLIALLVPVMYLDSAVDAMLKGLGEEVFCMKVNVVDSLLCLGLVFILVPSLGIDGYIALTIISEVVNASLSLWRLMKIAPVKRDLFHHLFLPVLSISSAYLVARAAGLILPDISLSFKVAVTVVSYGGFCTAFGAVERGDVRLARRVFSRAQSR